MILELPSEVAPIVRDVDETFLSLGIGYRYVMHNTLLEGSLIKDPPEFTKEPFRHMILRKNRIDKS